jgi:hypothetical protein
VAVAARRRPHGADSQRPLDDRPVGGGAVWVAFRSSGPRKDVLLRRSAPAGRVSRPLARRERAVAGSNRLRRRFPT